MQGCVNIPNIVIRSMLADKTNVLNICHFNACSIYPKIDYIRKIIHGSSISVICVSETWLGKHHTNAMVNIDGFNLVRNDRVNGRGGGVCIYISTNFNFKVHGIPNTGAKLEYLFVEIVLTVDKVVIGCVYNPPRCVDFSGIDNVLQSLSPLSEHNVG